MQALAIERGTPIEFYKNMNAHGNIPQVLLITSARLIRTRAYQVWRRTSANRTSRDRCRRGWTRWWWQRRWRWRQCQPASMDVAGPGDGNTQRRQLGRRAAERRQREDAEAAAAEEGLRRVGLRPGGQGGRGESEASDRCCTFDPGKCRKNTTRQSCWFLWQECMLSVCVYIFSYRTKPASIGFTRWQSP